MKDFKSFQFIRFGRSSHSYTEAILNLDTHVAHAIIFGRGRFNAGVLIDPIPELKFDPEDEDKLAAFRNVVW